MYRFFTNLIATSTMVTCLTYSVFAEPTASVDDPYPSPIPVTVAEAVDLQSWSEIHVLNIEYQNGDTHLTLQDKKALTKVAVWLKQQNSKQLLIHSHATKNPPASWPTVSLDKNAVEAAE